MNDFLHTRDKLLRIDRHVVGFYAVRVLLLC